ncbi:MAG: glycoside hydrolase family 2, partial [Gemmatimonadetes bacterium]|nr:glycoside hydrolase family 2 [Gemmatimonadota bacterium]
AGDRPAGDTLLLRWELYGWNALGERKSYASSTRPIVYRPYLSEAQAPLAVTMPGETSVAVLAVRLEDRAGTVLHHSFTTFVVNGDAQAERQTAEGRRVRVASVPANAVSDAKWSLKRWDVLDGLKVDGAGSGYFEYRIPWPTGLTRGAVEEGTFLVEASAKRLNGKDRDTTAAGEGDYMRGGGLHDPSRNRNSYPMTGDRPYPSAVTVWVNGRLAGRYELTDDPADHRGILSWASQTRDGFLREAGSYGQLLRVAIPAAALDDGARAGALTVRLEVSDALPGGLAIYGSKFGRYPLDPTVALVLRNTGSATR